MRHEPLISIITPTYNHEKYIEECIESVLAQTYKNWEMIIIDDASTDKTADIVEEYAKKDKRIKVIKHLSNYGALNLDKTYNEALNEAKGEWVAILEGDDAWPIYRLEKQVEILKQLDESIVLIHGLPIYIYEDLGIITLPRHKVSLKNTYPSSAPYNALRLLLLGFTPVYAQTVLVRKSSLLEVGGFIQKPENIMTVDFPTWLRLARKGNFYYLPLPLGFWRRHSASITMNNQDKTALACHQAIKFFLEELRENEKKEIIAKYGDEECFGKFQYFGAIFLSIMKKDFNQAKIFIDELEICISKGRIPITLASKIRLLLYKLSVFLRSNSFIRFLYNLKRKNVDKYVAHYKPHFIIDTEFNKKLLSYK